MALLIKPQQKTASIAAFAVDNYFFRGMAQDMAAISPGTEPKAPKALSQTAPKDSSTILSPLSQIKPETTQKIENIPQTTQPILPPEPSKEQKILLPTPAVKSPSPIAPLAQKPKNFKQIQQTQAKKLQEIEADKQKQIRANNEQQAKQLYKLAKQLYKKKNYHEAIANLQESLRLKPDLNKSKRYLNKTQEKLTKAEKKQQVAAVKIQQQAREIALRQAEQNTKQQIAQEIEQARLTAQQEVQQQAQELQQKITALKTQNYEQKLQQLQPQAPALIQPPISQPVPAPSPMPPTPKEQPPTSTLPPAIPSIQPLPAPPQPQISLIAKPQPAREQKFLFPTVKRIFPFKKLIIGIGAACFVLALASVVYWRFALKPTPAQPSPAPTTLKTPNIIIKLMRPSQETAGWQKIVQLAVSSAIKLPLENYQIDTVKDLSPWLGKELFYLNFDDTIDVNQPSGAFIWAVDDKTSSQALFEKIKSRQRSQVSLQNYRQFDIVNCQNQYWAFADVFNLHYLVLSQSLSSIKSVLDNLSEKNLDFIEYAESQTTFWRNSPNTALYLWFDPTNSQISPWQILRQLNLNVPVYVNQTLRSQAGIIFLDNFSPGIKDTRLAAVFSFADFDATNQAMTTWEKTLSRDVNFLFWNLKPTLPSMLNFQGNIYNNAVIRYLTMPDKNLGIYYGLTKEQLILTNSEDGAKMLIDNLQGI